jgi:hypothetical protein
MFADQCVGIGCKSHVTGRSRVIDYFYPVFGIIVSELVRSVLEHLFDVGEARKLIEAFPLTRQRPVWSQTLVET